MDLHGPSRQCVLWESSSRCGDPNGAIADVQFLQYPQDNGHSRQVSAKAIPILKQEAIAAQSAQVNIVSGATATSQAFQQSLADALAQA